MYFTVKVGKLKNFDLILFKSQRHGVLFLNLSIFEVILQTDSNRDIGF